MSEPIQKSRGNRFEIHNLAIGPNAIAVEYSEPGVHGSLTPPMELHDALHAKASKTSTLPDDLIVRLRDLLGELEMVLEPEYAKWEATPKAAHLATAKAMQAAQLAEAAAKDLALVESIRIVKQAEVDAMQERHDELVGRVVEMTAQLANGPVGVRINEAVAADEQFRATQEKSDGSE